MGVPLSGCSQVSNPPADKQVKWPPLSSPRRIPRSITVSRVQHTSAVLLATSDPRLQAKLWALLRSWGHPVDIVADGYALHQALERPESVPIVILDTDLPGLRGMALLHHSTSNRAPKELDNPTHGGGTVNRSRQRQTRSRHWSRRRPHQAHRRVRTPRLAACRLAHPCAPRRDGRGDRCRPISRQPTTA